MEAILAAICLVDWRGGDGVSEGRVVVGEGIGVMLGLTAGGTGEGGRLMDATCVCNIDKRGEMDVCVVKRTHYHRTEETVAFKH